MPKGKVDIIITSRNSEKFIGRLLDSIDRQSYRNFVCFVIDDDSSDGTVPLVEASYPWVELMVQSGRRGPAKNRNAAAKKSSSPFLVFFDADAFLSDDDWLAKAVDKMESDQNIGQLAAMIVSAADEDIILDCGIYGEDFLFRGSFHKKNKYFVWGKHLIGRQVLGACSAGTILRRDDFERVGGFDEGYFYMSEDLDLSIRIFLSGKIVEYEPSLVVHHHESHVMGADKDLKEFYYFRNNFFLLLKNYPLSSAMRKIGFFFLKALALFMINSILRLLLRKKRGVPFLPASNVFKIFFSLLFRFPVIAFERLSSRGYLKRARSSLIALNDELVKDIALEMPVTNLIFSITNVCNAKCRMCFQHSILNHASKGLSLDEIRRMVENSPQLKNVVLSGGEPFLRGDIEAICRIMTKGRDPIITIATNGSLPEVVYEKVKIILAQGCGKLVVSLSLDGDRSFHDENRGVPGLFDKVFECYDGLARLKSIYGDRLAIQVNTCVFKGNLIHLDFLAKTVSSKMKQADWMVEPVRGTFNDEWVSPLSSAEWEALSRRMDSLARDFFPGRDFSGLKKNYKYALSVVEKKRQPAPCCAGEEFLYVDHEGNVSPCELIPSIANLRDLNYDFNALLGIEKWREAVGGIKKGRCSCTHFCWLSASVEKSEQRKSLFFKVKRFIAKRLDRRVI